PCLCHRAGEVVGPARQARPGRRLRGTAAVSLLKGIRVTTLCHCRWALAALVLGAFGQDASAAAPPRTLEVLWADLGTDDAVKAEQAMARLVGGPAQTVPFLRRRVRPVTVDARRTARWLAELDSDTYAVRERASRELEGLCEAVEPLLRQALAAR